MLLGITGRFPLCLILGIAFFATYTVSFIMLRFSFGPFSWAYLITFHWQCPLKKKNSQKLNSDVGGQTGRGTQERKHTKEETKTKVQQSMLVHLSMSEAGVLTMCSMR